MANNMQLVKPTATDLKKPLTGGGVKTTSSIAPLSTTERARLGEQLILKMRLLANQPALDDKSLQIAGALWADELVKAGIPPSRWDEAFSLARRARASASKAFMVTADQVIDAWQHYLRREVWDVGEEAWREHGAPFVCCGQCRDGFVHHEQEIRRADGYAYTRTYVTPCRCLVKHSTQNSYYFRRFSAAFELAYGVPYDASDADLVALYKLMGKLKKPFWDGAVSEYFATPADHTLAAFCQSDVFEQVNRG